MKALLFAFLVSLSLTAQAQLTPELSVPPAKLHTVLFLCTGNYYRSRLSEGIFNFEAARRGLNWRAISRGLHITHHERKNVSPLVFEKLNELKIPHSYVEGDPVAVSRMDLETSDLIVVLNRLEHQGYLKELLKPVDDFRILWWEIEDIEIWPADKTMSLVVDKVKGLVDELASQTQKSPQVVGLN